MPVILKGRDYSSDTPACTCAKDVTINRRTTGYLVVGLKENT